MRSDLLNSLEPATTSFLPFVDFGVVAALAGDGDLFGLDDERMTRSVVGIFGDLEGTGDVERRLDGGMSNKFAARARGFLFFMRVA